MIADHFHPIIHTDALFPGATVLDVTLRDGSFAADFKWSAQSVRQIVRSLALAQIPLIELGYFGGVPELHQVENAGLTADFPLELVEELAAAYPLARFALMIHPGSVKVIPAFRSLKRAGVSMVRFVYHPDWAQTLCQFLTEAQHAGLTTAVNLALSSRYDRQTLREVCREVASWSPSVIYLADTCGAFYPSQIARLFDELRASVSTPLGFHAHDFLSLALANSLTAASAGASYIDISLAGIGRGAGNVRTETWCISSIAQDSVSYDVEALLPGLQILQEYGLSGAHQDLISVVCGACNLTPPEEQLLRDFALKMGYSPDQVACKYALCQGQLPHLSWQALQRMFEMTSYISA